MQYRSTYAALVGLSVLALGLVHHTSRLAYDSGLRQVAANSTQTILLWYPHSTFFQLGPGRGGFAHCPVSDCALTDDRSLHAAVSAVLVRGSQRSGLLPTHAHPAQILVYLEFESPMSVHPGRLTDTAGLFNLSMTYLPSPDTDIHTPYGAVLRRTEPDLGAMPSAATLRAKRRLVAWVVSNCHPTSTRKEYAEQLSKYISVDIYGHCGNLSCSKTNASCYKELTHDHLFILSFENAYCTDYVTEKLFRPLGYNIVPVVLGRASYSDILSPKSFIDVRDFNSPRHLAEYLLYLDQNRTAYGEYFSWKTEFVVKNSGYTRPQAFCRLCEILHDQDYRYRPPWDPAVYWSRKTLCLRDDLERREVHLL